MRIHTTAIAAALVTASAATLAQSSVTIYGRVDLGLFHQNGGNSNINAGNNRVVAGVPVATRNNEIKDGSAGRIGFRGAEDLGGGLSANFLMESRYTFDTGVANTPFFQARSFLDLTSKQFGQVYLGREYFPAFWVGLRLDPWGFDSVGTNGTKHAFAEFTITPSQAVSPDGIRGNNTVGYKTPSFGGVTVQLAHSAGEGIRSDSNGGNVEYRAGPIYAGAAFERVDDRNKLALVGATYDFGFVKPGLLYTEATINNIKRNNKLVSASVPFGPGFFKFAASKLDPQGTNNDTTRVGFGYEYLLSKRTSLLANVGTSKQQGVAAGLPLSRTTLWDATIKHNF